MEKILEIKEIIDNPDKINGDGFNIITTDQTIELRIGTDQLCCENYGYFMSEDNFSEFIGANILGLKITDVNRNTIKSQKEFEDLASDDDYIFRNIMFVDIETDEGVLQFVAYNSQNGYYGHEASVKSNQLKYNIEL